MHHLNPEFADVLRHWESGPLRPTFVRGPDNEIGYHVLRGCELSIDETSYRPLDFRVEVVASRPPKYPYTKPTTTPYYYKATMVHPTRIHNAPTRNIVALREYPLAWVSCPEEDVSALCNFCICAGRI